MKSATAYIDGAYNAKTGVAGWGLIFLSGDDKLPDCEYYGIITNPALTNMRNVAGEITAADKALVIACDKGIKLLDIYYDYLGVEKWVTGEWVARNINTINYATKFRYLTIRHNIDVSFHHVKAHSGNTNNERADYLAKIAVGLKEPKIKGVPYNE